jgi:hypothetical protein
MTADCQCISSTVLNSSSPLSECRPYPTTEGVEYVPRSLPRSWMTNGTYDDIVNWGYG